MEKLSRDKQIEEMAQAILEVGDNYDTCLEEDCETIAVLIYDKGYRKASDVAREIIDDLESQILPRGEGLYAFPVITHEFIAELKKKYTEER